MWHGCTRRSRTASAHAPTVSTPAPPPPPPPSPSSSSWQQRGTGSSTPSSTPTLPPQVLALQESVASLTTRCTAFTERFDAIEARINSLVTQNATTERTLATLVESHQAIIHTVNTFSEKLEALATRMEMVCDHVTKDPPQRAAQKDTPPMRETPSASQKNKKK